MLLLVSLCLNVVLLLLARFINVVLHQEALFLCCSWFPSVLM